MRIQRCLISFVALLSVVGCGSTQNSASSGRGPEGPSFVDSGGPGETGAGGSVALPQSGSLTAGIWDDNANFDEFERYREDLWDGNTELEQANGRLFAAAEQEAAHGDAEGDQPTPSTLDVALVIDTTGSMGDEIAYLQSEFRDFSADINGRYPNAEVRWSLVVYRDQGDAYLVQHDDFTADPETFRGSLAQHNAGGGGDYPEAPEVALVRAHSLSWRASQDTAKLAFWVADAPPHVENLSAFADSVRDLQARDVAIYPVASSGVDENTEYFMRATAQLTGGRYVFITNDSGIGLDHKEPTIPCYYVTLLRDALLRAIDAEMKGAPDLPSKEQVIRSVGEPDAAGECQLEQGTAQAF